MSVEDGGGAKRFVVVLPPARVMELGYVPSLEQWLLMFLCEYQHDTFCVFRAEEAVVRPQA